MNLLATIQRGYTIVRTMAIEARPAVRDAMDAYLREHPTCAYSGNTVHCNVHHIYPAHLCVKNNIPSLLTNPMNMITLSRGVADNWGGEDNWHWRIGHLRDWSSYNPDVSKQCEFHQNWKAQGL